MQQIKTKQIENSVFIKYFRASPVNKVLDFLVVFDKFDYSMMDIAEKAGVGYSTLKLLLPELLKRKILIQTRITGKSSMYQINKSNPIIQKFIRFYWDITNKLVENQIKSQKILA